MRLLIFFLFITITICSNAQPGDLVEITKKWPRKDIIVSNGMTYEYTLPTDTARYFDPAGKKFKVKIVFTEEGNLPDIITNIDNVSTVTANTYAPAWIQFTNSAFFNSTASYSPTTGAKLTTKFTGYKIEWWSEFARNHGIATVKIDNLVQFSVDLYGNTTVNNSQKVFEWTGTEGLHTIEITVTGTKNTAATESNVIHDYFRTYSKQ